IKPLLEVSASDWLGPLDPRVARFYAGLLAAEFAADLDDLPALFLLTCMPPHGERSEGSWGDFLAPPGGCPDICEALAGGLRRKPLTGAEVVSVSQGPGGCQVDFFRRGRRQSMSADRVVVATPPGRLPQLVPALPPAKLEALRSLSVHPIVEVS